MNIKEIDNAKLQEAITHFESIHGAIEEVGSWFIGEIVEFTQKALKDEDSFTNSIGIIEADDLVKTTILVNHIYEDGLDPVISGDEVKALITEIVRAIVTQENPDNINPHRNSYG